MNFFSFHIGDYHTHTAHLEPLEDLAYRRMLDIYYLREGPLPLDPNDVARLVRMKGQEDVVVGVLDEFFEPCDDGWRHQRCDEELLRMRDKQAKAKASAEASVNARKAKAAHPQSEGSTDAERTLNERSTDAELPIPIPRPLPIPKRNTKAATAAVVRPDDVDEKVWSDFMAMRKAKGAPVTATALEGIRREAAKAQWQLEAALRECCARGWRGFKAEWVTSQQITAETPYQRAARERMAEFAPGVAARPPSLQGRSAQVIDLDDIIPRLEG